MRLIAIIIVLSASAAFGGPPRNWDNAPTLKGSSPASTRRVILYFTAPWCGPCKEARRNLNNIPHSFKVYLHDPKGEKPDADVILVDIEDHPEMAEAWGIDTLPTFVRCETTPSKELKKLDSCTGILSTSDIVHLLNGGAVKARAVAQMSVRDDPDVCSCGCGRPGCQCGRRAAMRASAEDVCQCGCGMVGCRCQFQAGRR